MSNAPDTPGPSGTTAVLREHHAPAGNLLALAAGALGVVFGDIGTSPLYTLAAGIAPRPGQPADVADVLGVCSLIVWALILVVTVKYLTFVMRADNQGEGGILALLALVPKKAHARLGRVTVMVVAGASLLYGDGIITPAISVLSALEGVELAAPSFKSFVVPLTCAVLLALFAIQRQGTGGLGKIFGPVMVVWFFVIAALGAWQIAKHPTVLVALNPAVGARYFERRGLQGLPILGVVVLAVTGGEALYADMGHFGARAIRVAWLALVFPALVLCYLGQCALVLSDPRAVENPFFAMVPTGWPTYSLVALATAATIIASQALISGVFSLTHQAVQLGLFPRVTVTHTSRRAEGQIYVPEMNWALCILCIALVLGFRESARLAAAYGIAVSGTMGITSGVFFVVTRRTWKWPLWKALPPLVLFLSFDLPFFAANLTKVLEGGFIPLLVGAVMLVVMLDWKVGRTALADHIAETSGPLADFIANIDTNCPVRIPGTAILLASDLDATPPVLTTQVRRLRTLREHVVLVTVITDHVPYAKPEDRVACHELGHGFDRVEIHAGYMEKPDIPRLLAEVNVPDLEDATYFIGRESFVVGRGGRLGVLAEGLFAFLSRNAKSATSWFGIPPNQVVELGMQIDL